MLCELLRPKKATIAERWLEGIRSAYPSLPRGLGQSGRDRFANPVEYTMAEGTKAIVAGLLDGADAAALASPLEDMIKIRAVQDLSPARAIGFVYQLKEVIRATLRGRLGDAQVLAALLDLEGRIDALALQAFELYVACREKIHELRAQELRRRVSGRLGYRLDPGGDDLEGGTIGEHGDGRRACRGEGAH